MRAASGGEIRVRDAGTFNIKTNLVPRMGTEIILVPILEIDPFLVPGKKVNSSPGRTGRGTNFSSRERLSIYVPKKVQFLEVGTRTNEAKMDSFVPHIVIYDGILVYNYYLKRLAITIV
jgi:hypothetical protein